MAVRIGRRQLLVALGGAAGWPLRARAQQPTNLVIGFLSAGSPESPDSLADVRAFRIGLNETGYVEGGNVTIEYRWAENVYDRLPTLAADLVDRRVSVIATGSNSVAAIAAQAATTTIPIVFLTGADPVKAGLVTSLSRPGGNLTGVTTLNTEITPKRVEMLRELVPNMTMLAVLANPLNNPAVVEVEEIQAQAAARTLGLEGIQVLHASTERELDIAFTALTQQRAGGLVITADSFFSGKSAALAGLAFRHRVPAISPYRQFAEAGGVMSYGIKRSELYRLIGVYTGRILKGDKPADLPVQQASNIELVVSLKTAKALGLSVPLTLLARADEVIE